LSFLSIIGIAVGLGMDVFAVSIASSCMIRKIEPRQYFRMSFHFGFFQFMMPVIGWLAGSGFSKWFAAFDHWIAFGLLAIIGLKMIYDSRRSRDVGAPPGDPTRGLMLVLLSVATSIDALAAGLSFAFLEMDIWYPSIVIGVTAALMSFLGLRMGRLLGVRFGRRMEVVGGIVLIGIGISIPVEHLVA
jgi:putative Mn2+ efflux pump MntP